MRGTALRSVTAAAMVTLAGCTGSSGGTGGPESSPSPSSQETTRLEFVSERDLFGLMTEDDLPESLDLAVYESIRTVPTFAQEQVDEGWIGSAEPKECVDLNAVSVLMLMSDVGQASTDTVLFLFDIGGTGAAETDPSTMFMARVFSTEEDAAAFLGETQRIAEACAGGFVSIYSDGTTWENSRVEVNTNAQGYPSGVSFLAIDIYADGYDLPAVQLLAQYENVIVTAVDISSETSAWLTGRDMQTYLRLSMDRLVGGA